MDSPLSYGRQQISEEDIQEIVRVLRSDYLSGGPEIDLFEQAFADYIGAPYAMAVANGTAALHLCAMALNVQPDQTWITSPLTFAATAHCIRLCGARVEFVDIDPQTGLIDLDLLEQKLKQAPAGTYHGVLPVDYAGYPVDMVRVRGLANEFGLRIIEDACHAPGGQGNGFRCGDGRYADLAIFSFHPVKHLTTGEGGMITTADADLARRIRSLRTHGIERDKARLPADAGGWYYEIRELGLNYRLSAFQAALGRSQLTRARENLNRRRNIADYYQRHLQGSGFQLPPPVQGHAWHLYVIQHPRRQQLYQFLRDRHIYPQVHYVPLHHHPYYRDAAEASGPLAMTDQFYNRCLSIPMYPDLSGTDLSRITATLEAFGKKW